MMASPKKIISFFQNEDQLIDKDTQKTEASDTQN